MRVWRGDFGVAERALWALVTGWLLVAFFQWALFLGVVVFERDELPPAVWFLLLRSASVVFVALLAVYSARRGAFGGWFVIAVHLAREGAYAPVLLGVPPLDFPFNLYPPVAILVYMLMLLGAAVIASGFDSRSPSARRLQLTALAGFVAVAVVSKAIVFHLGSFYIGRMLVLGSSYRDAIPSSIVGAVDFLGWSLVTVMVYALLRQLFREDRTAWLKR